MQTYKYNYKYKYNPITIIMRDNKFIVTTEPKTNYFDLPKKCWQEFEE